MKIESYRLLLNSSNNKLCNWQVLIYKLKLKFILKTKLSQALSYE